MTSKIGIIDLFCGCGGMSLGLRNLGCQILAGVEYEEKYFQTYRSNFPEAKHYLGDIRELKPFEVLKDLALSPGDLDILVGGPPCQGFSKNVPAAYRFLEDDRNQLFRDYLRFVKAMLPKTVVMENVAEMYNAYDGHVREEIESYMEGLGYDVVTGIHVAADYGVPQKRRRFLMIGSRTGTAPHKLQQTHESPRKDSPQSSLFQNLPWVSAYDAISDLPFIDMGEGTYEATHKAPPKNAFQEYARNGQTSYYNHVANVMKPTQRARMESIKAGQGLKDLPPELRPKSGYSGAYGRLDFESVAPTITRWVFHPGSGRFSHPVVPRNLTMREAARLQSFTDDFEFIGSRIDIAHQIGNAVPPLLMTPIYNVLSKCLSVDVDVKAMDLAYAKIRGHALDPEHVNKNSVENSCAVDSFMASMDSAFRAKNEIGYYYNSDNYIKVCEGKS